MSKWLKYLVLAVLPLFLANSALAQGSLYSQIAWRYTPAGVFPASGATITICTSSATGAPCTPTVTVYQDSALSIPVANPLAVCSSSPQFGCIDGLGNFAFYASPGAYTYTVTGAGLTAYGPIPFGLSCIAGVTCPATSSANPWTALQTFSAGLTSAGPNTLNGGGTTAGSWTHAGLHTFSAGITSTTGPNSFGGTTTFANTPLPSGAGTIPLGTQALPWFELLLGTAASQATELHSLALANRLVNIPDAAGSMSLAVVEACGSTSGATQACAKTVQTNPIVVWGDVLLNTAVSQSIITLPFTDNSYSCTGSDLTTAAGIVSFNTYASASVTIQESGGANTDHLRYVCVGH